MKLNLRDFFVFLYKNLELLKQLHSFASKYF